MSFSEMAFISFETGSLHGYEFTLEARLAVPKGLRDPPASVFPALGLHTPATTPDVFT